MGFPTSGNENGASAHTSSNENEDAFRKAYGGYIFFSNTFIVGICKIIRNKSGAWPTL